LQAPPADGRSVSVVVSPKSSRLQVLEPFATWDGRDLADAAVLIKVKGKCTTDHISMAGPWLKYRGHLDNISNNMLIGALNSENNAVNSVFNRLTGKYDAVPAVARAYKAKRTCRGLSVRVHGGRVVPHDLALDAPQSCRGWWSATKTMARAVRVSMPRWRSATWAAAPSLFARLRVSTVRHRCRCRSKPGLCWADGVDGLLLLLLVGGRTETNLKKQGVLPLTFADPADYDKIKPRDSITLRIANIAPGKVCGVSTDTTWVSLNGKV
jgi:hypothetical protein